MTEKYIVMLKCAFVYDRWEPWRLELKGTQKHGYPFVFVVFALSPTGSIKDWSPIIISAPTFNSWNKSCRKFKFGT